MEENDYFITGEEMSYPAIICSGVFPAPVEQKRRYDFPPVPELPLKKKVMISDPYWDVGWFGFKKTIRRWLEI